MQKTFNFPQEMTAAEKLAAAVAGVAEPGEMALIDASIGPVDERNRPLVIALLSLLDASLTITKSIADNCIETHQNLASVPARLTSLVIAEIARCLTISATWSESEALPALPQGHRLPTNLDGHQ